MLTSDHLHATGGWVGVKGMFEEQSGRMKATWTQHRNDTQIVSKQVTIFVGREQAR